MVLAFEGGLIRARPYHKHGATFYHGSRRKREHKRIVGRRKRRKDLKWGRKEERLEQQVGELVGGEGRKRTKQRKKKG